MTVHHIHDQYEMNCGHIIECGCNHNVNDDIWCMQCKDYRQVIRIIIGPLDE